LGISKKDPESYKFIADDLKVLPEEIFFTDDTESNIEAAKLVGVKTHLYLSNKDLIQYLEKL
jgi:HAD superfamily hydrolase (TIGR01509 family)